MLASVRAAAPPFTHLSRLTDARGLFEHALGDQARSEHGYCLDDVARALVVTAREPSPSPRVADMTEIYLRFIESAVEMDGSAHNRMDLSGRWTDVAGHGDWWGRAIRALGTAAAHAPLAHTRRRALRCFARATRRSSPDLRALVFAGLGAAEVLAVAPQWNRARRMVDSAAKAVTSGGDPAWPWPEPRLRYSNGVIPEMLIAGGAAVGDAAMTARGLDLLTFLLRIETDGGHLSVTGSEGRGPEDQGAQFDQQPLEVAALCGACARAFDVTGDGRWLEGVHLAWSWFLGDNDSGTPMIDVETGAGHDGLTPTGRNDNRGAESTLAALSTYQHARRLLPLEECA